MRPSGPGIVVKDRVVHSRSRPHAGDMRTGGAETARAGLVTAIKVKKHTNKLQPQFPMALGVHVLGKRFR